MKLLKSQRRLLVCPNCEVNGSREILGELDEQGNLIVMRFKGGGDNRTTKVVSPQMLVQCGKCGEVVFYKKQRKII